MNKFMLTAALIMSPAITLANHDKAQVEEIKAEIREGHRQLREDEEAGDNEAARETKRQIAEDEARLREATRHPYKKPLNTKAPAAGEVNGEIKAAPPEPETDELRNRRDSANKLNPEDTFNRSATVPTEIR